jgi:ornithine cyclodeaminase
MPPPSIPILSDEDVRSALSMREAIELIESVFRLKAGGSFLTPPRFYVGNDRGALAFTVGGHASGGSIGFRVYETFPGPNLRHEQFVAVFDGTSGELRGLVFGELLGAMRTGAIGGVAVKCGAREDAKTVGIVGSGMQARTQLMAIAAVRGITGAKAYSRSAEKRDAFAREMTESLGLPVLAVATAEEAVEGVDIVVTATSNTVPLFPATLIEEGTHINALGPKFAKVHELDPAVAERASAIYTDSPEQLRGYPAGFFLGEEHAIADLAVHVANGTPVRRSAGDITLFCSVGLSGTEVVLADAVLSKAV